MTARTGQGLGPRHRDVAIVDVMVERARAGAEHAEEHEHGGVHQ
jgi:hypothetical protein